MIKKLLFVLSLHFLSFNAFQVFAGLYDDEDTQDISTPSDNMPLFDTTVFGLENLKTWWNAKPKKRKQIDSQNENRIKAAIAKRLNKQNDEATQLFKEGAQNGCPVSMYWLGFIDEQNKKYTQAFSWYMLSFFTQMIKSDSGPKGIQTCHNVLANLDKLVKTDSVCEKRKAYYKAIKEQMSRMPAHILPSHPLFMQAILRTIVIAHQKYFPHDKKLSAFSVGVNAWLLDKQLFPRLAEEAAGCAATITNSFFNLDANVEAIYCMQLFKTNNLLGFLGDLILDNKCDYNENNTKFEEKDRAKIGSVLLWKTQDPKLIEKLIDRLISGKIAFDAHGKPLDPSQKNQIIADLIWKQPDPSPTYLNYLGCLILHADKLKDANKKIIPKENKTFMAVEFFRKANIPQSIENIAKLIIDGKITNDLHNKPFSREERYEKAAEICRIIKTPDACDLLAHLISEGHVTKDLDGNPFTEDQKHFVEADLHRKSRTPSALYNLGRLISLNLISQDLDNKEISNNKKTTANLYRQSGIPDAMTNYAFLIEQMEISVDFDGNMFSESERYNIAAALYSKSKTQRSFHFVAHLIQENLIAQDYEGKAIESEEQKEQIITDLYTQANFPESKIALAIIKLQSSSEQPIETMIQALNLLDEARLAGNSQADLFYTILHQKIDEEKGTQPILHIENPIETKNENQESSLKPTQSQDEVMDDESSSDNSTDENDSCPELSWEDKQNLKALKKRDRVKNEANRHFKKLLQGKLSKKEGASLIPKMEITLAKTIKIQWNKKAIDQWKSLNNDEKKLVQRQISNIQNGDQRSGKPKKLKNCDFISRRITQEHRLVYQLLGNGDIEILQCWEHYDD
ncbi:MAG: type II toxin-antitoxin system YoeB family toxin [Alphaproteobacteria bacterium]|nr:type II toxin-antitoxin system YoeB family toxin [Alphaproteobacteria bacterium]